MSSLLPGDGFGRPPKHQADAVIVANQTSCTDIAIPAAQRMRDPARKTRHSMDRLISSRCGSWRIEGIGRSIPLSRG
jgi:hypothetical protein